MKTSRRLISDTLPPRAICVIYRSMEYSRSEGREALYGQLARIGKVVMHPKRVELLDLLCQSEQSVEALAAATGLKLTTASAHLQVMRQARLVETRRVGTRVYYSAAGDEVCRLVTTLSDLAKARLAEVDRILSTVGADHPDATRVTREELLERVRAGDVVVVDVRPANEYESCHIEGSLSIPLEHLEAQLEELDPDVEVVAYCRGPLCLLAPEAVSKLRALGRRAMCLIDGLPEWRQAGLPVSSGPDQRFEKPTNDVATGRKV